MPRPSASNEIASGMISTQRNENCPIPPETHVLFDKVEDLPIFENLQLVHSTYQIRVPSHSPFLCWSIDQHKAFIEEYHSCEKVTAFLTDKGITSPPSWFGRVLPSVMYQRKNPCRFCGGVSYKRRVATHSDLYHTRSGILYCNGCDGWINLNHCSYFGKEFSWSRSPPVYDPRFSTVESNGLGFTGHTEPFEPKKKPKIEQKESNQIDKSINQDFLSAVLQRYVPEYQHSALTAYISGELSLEHVQERTGIFIET